MSERIRALNQEGTRQFRQFVDSLRADTFLPVPTSLLADSATSEDVVPEMLMESIPLASRVELGSRLADWLRPAEPRAISRNAGLWNWLSLRLFEQICPAQPSGRRKVLATSHYVLDQSFVHGRYYRHLVRFAWLATVLHGDKARILLSNPSSPKNELPVGQWGEMSEQLGARQDVLGSKTIISAANLLYLDNQGNQIRGAASQDRRGVVRRLSDIANQLFLTYDLRTCPVQEFINLLPDEFERWVREYRKRSARVAKEATTSGAMEADRSSALRI
jgi:hypothetical protein